ncbi:hypothetical protein [Streptomyces sp. NPDC047968]|uniref:hypothetical protein n=1 Tax=unclassified Streptomyces TaxID=2593676 RepID=UPI00342C76D9
MRTFDPAAAAAVRRAEYGPEELDGLAVYGDVVAALGSLGLHPYIETRGGLAVCAFAPDGSVVVVACQDALPLRREMVMGWHITHVPEDEVAPRWRCHIYDSTPRDLCCDPRGDLSLSPLAVTIGAHLRTCTHSTTVARQCS